ncbi:MAG: extracellular solute-binding protein [Firmicutes bacterium]|nr:extracellular solute-binding protein [Bacillota bacterium]
MKKKFLVVLLAAVLGSTLISGCGSDPSKAESGQKKKESAENSLTVWAWDKTFNIYAMEEAEKIYQAQNPDFSLEIVEVGWDDMQTKLSTIVGSGNYDQLPDILLMQDFAYQKYCITYPDLFQDLTDSGIDFSQFAEGKVNASVVEGKNYGVPFDNGTEIAAYRTDILEQAGYTIEDLTDIDWNRFMEIGKDVYEKTGYSLVSVQAASSDLIYQMMQSAGASTWNEDGAVNFTENDILKQCIEIYKEMADAHVMQIVNSWDEYIGTFTSGKACGVINGCWIMASMQTAESQAGNWQITNFPSLPGVEGATNYSNQGGSTWAITTNCQDTDLAVDFLKNTFAGSKELYDTILPGAGALATWLPASESDVYAEPQEFYGGQQVYTLLSEFSEKVPSVDLGVYYTEANRALSTLLSNVVAGADIDAELETAKETVEFDMK